MPRSASPPRAWPDAAARTVESRASLALVPPRAAGSVNRRSPALYFDAELSWLEFNARVLSQALDPSHPLLERVKFLAISAANLDEFFMLRVSALVKKLDSETHEAFAAREMTRRLRAIRDRVRSMLGDQSLVWNTLRASLRSEGILVAEPQEWTTGIRSFLSAHFSREIAPVLTPLAFEPGCRFPSTLNPDTHVLVSLRRGADTVLSLVKIPRVLPRFIETSTTVDEHADVTLVLVEDVIQANIATLFPGLEVTGAHLCRVVRDADVSLDVDARADLLEAIEGSLTRRRTGAVTMIHVSDGIPAHVLALLTASLEASADVVWQSSGRIGVADWVQLSALPRASLKDAPWTPPAVWRAHEHPDVIFGRLRHADVLVHHPYESFESVHAFISAATRDPHVLAIKMTVYRIGVNSPLAAHLIEAAESGKEVLVLVELRARRDERTNSTWARKLRAHGVQVVFGLADAKTHAKLCLVVRREPDGVRGYVHASSGNYNADTSRVYTDIGLFTADAAIADDVSAIFNHLTDGARHTTRTRLLVGPAALRTPLGDLVRRESDHARAGRPARIVIKVNGLTDERMIRELYHASQAGVSIDLVVRGACRLRPGVPGVSDRIRVRSIVGRFLEHSRIFWFQNDRQDEIYIGSADLMERNLDRRVEVLIPVRDQTQRSYLRDTVLGAYLRDTARAMDLDASGQYHRPPAPAVPFDAQAFLLQHHSARRRV